MSNKIVNLPDRQVFKLTESRRWIGDELLRPFNQLRKNSQLMNVAWNKKSNGSNHVIELTPSEAANIVQFWPSRNDVQELQRQASIVINTPFAENDTVDLLGFLLDAHSNRNFDDVMPYITAALLILNDRDNNLSPHAIARGILNLLRDLTFFPSHQQLRQAAADARAAASMAQRKLAAMQEMIDVAHEVCASSPGKLTAAEQACPSKPPAQGH